MRDYREFLEKKVHLGDYYGFEPNALPDYLYDFQRDLVLWALRKGRGAIFADCGLGKTPMQLAWANAIAAETNRPILIATPLAVSYQLLREAEKFGVEASRSIDGILPKSKIVVTNYERLDRFNPSDFVGLVCDESSILKNFDGVRRAVVTEFVRKLPYRLLCTATAAPNDYIELGTSSEALGELGHMDMLSRFFRNVDGGTMGGAHSFRFRHKDRSDAFHGKRNFWRFKGHAEQPFWRWVCSWARALRRPSDLGYDDNRFKLPPLKEREYLIDAMTPREGMLFDLPAVGLHEQREERRRTIAERCEKVAELVDTKKQALVWCHLNAEGDLLSNLISDAQQVKGSDSDDVKEERLVAFAEGKLRVLVTKPKIGAWGLNLQRCAHVTFFPSHSYEQYYQGVRRCWRFGQTRPVRVDIVATPGDAGVTENLRRKAAQADRMFSALVAEMAAELSIKRSDYNPRISEVPAWLG